MRATIGDDSFDNGNYTEEDISVAIRRHDFKTVDLNNRGVPPSVDMTNIYPSTSFSRNISGNKFIVKHAIVAKQCPSMPLLWQDRFFVLKTDGSMYYYLNVSIEQRCVVVHLCFRRLPTTRTRNLKELSSSLI